jgi:hypothetical protein
VPAFNSFGVFKNDQVTNGGSIGFGQNIIQNRNATKQNNGSITVGDGLNLIGNGPFLNADTDGQDMTNIDTNNIGAPQI